MSNPPFPQFSRELIGDAAQLWSLCDAWRQRDAIALDTEFVRTDTYYAKLGLVQIFDGDKACLLDPLQPELRAPLGAVLGDAGLIKVLHSCSEDIQILQSYCGVEVVNVFDTQLGAAMAGLGFSLSYQKLVGSLCGARLPKDATRSDWLQRPLTVAQLDYAALDVIYLLDIHTRLRRQLQRDQRLAWLQEDCAGLLRQVQADPDLERLYLRIKVAWQLNAEELHILRALCVWRELYAMRRDRPRNWIVSDRALVSLARQRPTALEELNSIDDLSARASSRHGRVLLGVIANCVADDPVLQPPVLAKPMGRSQNALLKKLKALARDKAAELGMAAEVLVRKKDYEQLLRCVEQGIEELEAFTLPGWRHAAIGGELVALVRKENNGRTCA